MLKNKDFIPETFASYERVEFEVEITKYPQSVDLDEVELPPLLYELSLNGA